MRPHRPLGGTARLSLGMAMLALSSPASAGRDIAPVIAMACAKPVTGDELRARLAEAALVQAGVMGSELEADPTLPKAGFGARAMAAMQQGRVSAVNDPMRDIPAVRQRLEQYLGPRSNRTARKLEAVDPPSGTNWLFDAGRPLSLKCVSPKPATPIIDQYENPVDRPVFALREKVDELGFAGEAAKKAGAAKIGLKRTETRKDDGSRKVVTSLSLNGTAGLRLTANASPAPLYLYGRYALSRERTRPDPDPNKRQSDGDVNVLETGLSVQSFLLRSASDVSLVGSVQAALATDFAYNARRLKLRASLVPGLAASLAPLCDIGGFTDVTAIGLRFRTRCLITLEAEGSHVLEAGNANFKQHGEFFGLGGTLAYQVAAPIGDKAAVLGGISYRYLPTIAGTAANISRFEGSLKYRFWLDNGPAIDLGLTWVKGEEPVAYTDEDKFELGFGLVF